MYNDRTHYGTKHDTKYGAHTSTACGDTMTDMPTTALDYVRAVRSGQINVEEFVARSIDRIKDIDGKLHAFLSTNEQGAIDQARTIDKKIQSGQRVGACYGMPISIKDNICIKGTKTTCASRMLEDFVAPYDATVISRLRQQDAIFIGKTNLDEFAMGITTEFSAFGPSKNPWNTDYVPGGSSGGSAVSVSASECIASLGSDTGGSVRNPSSFCSLVGYKPTYGLVSRYGLISYANSIEQIGPLTRTVSDTAFLLNIISGRDPNDDTTILYNHNNNNSNDSQDSSKIRAAYSNKPYEPPDYLDGIDSGVQGLKVGIVSEMIHPDGTDPEVLKATMDAASNLEQLGATCQEVSLDTIQYSVAAYYTITSTEAGSNLARYDNIRYGYTGLPVDGYEFNSYIQKARSMFGSEVKRRMLLGGFVPSAGNAGKYFLKALKVKNMLIRQMRAMFRKYDILIAPTVPVLPFKFGEKIDDPISLFMVDTNTVAANLTGRPAISIPFAISQRVGLPIGVQLMADSMKDRQLLQAAYSLEQTVSLPEVPYP